MVKTKVENLNACTRVLKIEVSSDELSQKFEQVYTEIGKVARVPGYRSGHVPRDLL